MAEPVAEAVGEMAAQDSRVRAFVRRRRDPVAATGLALTIALGAVIVGGVVIGLLAFLVRSNRAALDLDTGPARWGFEHASEFTTTWLNRITDLGDGTVVIVLAIVLAIAETIRAAEPLRHPVHPRRDARQPHRHGRREGSGGPRPADAEPDRPDARPVVPERPLVDGGVVLRLRRAADRLPPRARRAHHLAGARRRHPGRRRLHAACCSTCTGSSDVIAGLCLGWAWFAVCAIAFGGRLLRFGAAAEQAEDAARAATGAAPVKV